jgi:putative nucleotidyltransferase with HDIG domain
VKRTLRLRGISGPGRGQTWESDALLRAGRLASLEVPLDDSSVSRRHAEVRAVGPGQWVVRDLESTNGTFVNGVRLAAGADHPVKSRDVVQFGKVALLVELVDTPPDGPPSDQLVLAATVRPDPLAADEGLGRLAMDQNLTPLAGEKLRALLRAGLHLRSVESEDALLHAVLGDAVSVLDAQRGAIVLADGDGPDARLTLKAMSVGGSGNHGRFLFSKRHTQRCFDRGESCWFKTVKSDDELMTQSVADGEMASILCVLLRTPRRKLGVLHLDRGVLQAPFTEDDLHLADALAAQVSAGIEAARLVRRQEELYQRTLEMMAEMVEGMVGMVELKDAYTAGHTTRVTRYSLMLAEKLKLGEDQLKLLKRGAPLHDIGKIGIPDAILGKPGRLTAAEFAVMQTHTTLGAEKLAVIPELHPIIPIVRSHHERWDGTGYPDRLAKTDIPLLARIVAVADAFDAMTTPRPYYKDRRGKTPEYAFGEVEKQAGRHFDPDCAAAFVAIKDEVLRTMFELMPDTGSHTAPPAATVVGLQTPELVEEAA